MALAPGTKAPDFTLKTLTDSGPQDISLNDGSGKPTVLLFFPAAFSSICTDELCSVSAGIGAYQSLNARVIAISVDTPHAQQAFAKQEKFSFPLASDMNKTVTKAYDVLFEGFAAIYSSSARAAFVIDKNGMITHSEQTPTPKEIPDFDAVKKALEALA
jgi:peroxiredoxin